MTSEEYNQIMLERGAVIACELFTRWDGTLGHHENSVSIFTSQHGVEAADMARDSALRRLAEHQRINELLLIVGADD